MILKVLKMNHKKGQEWQFAVRFAALISTEIQFLHSMIVTRFRGINVCVCIIYVELLIDCLNELK